MSAPETFVGLDLGTSAVKGVVVDAADGTVRARAERPLALLEPAPLAAEQDPEAWVAAASAVLRELAAAAAGTTPLALGLTGQKHALVALDAAGRPLAPAVLWCDGRAVEETAEVHARAGRALGRRTGSLGFPGYLLPKWLRLRRLAPGVAARTVRLVGAKDYLRLRYTGVHATDRTEASASLLFDIGRKAWAPDLLEAFDVPASLLPPVVRSSDVAGRLSAAAAEATGLPTGLPVVGGAGDNEAAALGCGALGEGRVAVVLGTSATVIAHHGARGAAGGVAWGRHALRQGYAATGVVLSAGRALEWVRRAAFAPGTPTAAVVDAAEASDPAEGALAFVPSLVGERSPVPDPAASGAFAGLRPGHGRGHLARAVLEGVACAVADVLQVLRGAGVPVTELRLTSGGAQAAFWRRLVGAAAGLPVVLAGEAEGPAVGAAMLAARSTGRHGGRLVDLAARWLRPGPPELPDPAEVARLSRLRAYHAAVRNALRAVGAPGPGPTPAASAAGGARRAGPAVRPGLASPDEGSSRTS